MSTIQDFTQSPRLFVQVEANSALTCDVDPWLVLLMHHLETRLPVPSYVPSYQQHHAVLEAHSNHAHVLVGSDGHDGGGRGVGGSRTDGAGQCGGPFLGALVKVPDSAGNSVCVCGLGGGEKRGWGRRRGIGEGELWNINPQCYRNRTCQGHLI